MLFCFDYPALLELLSYLTQALSIPVMNWGFCVTWLSELILVFTFNFFTQQRIVAIFFWKSVLYLPKTQWNSCICLGSSRAPSLILEPSVYQLFTAWIESSIFHFSLPGIHYMVFVNCILKGFILKTFPLLGRFTTLCIPQSSDWWTFVHSLCDGPVLTLN